MGSKAIDKAEQAQIGMHHSTDKNVDYFLKAVKKYIKSGTSTFCKASKGIYIYDSKDLNEIKQEIFGTFNQKSDDKRRLIEDRRNVEMDIRKAFDKIREKNG